jgi:hypothetical protein
VFVSNVEKWCIKNGIIYAYCWPGIRPTNSTIIQIQAKDDTIFIVPFGTYRMLIVMGKVGVEILIQ